MNVSHVDEVMKMNASIEKYSILVKSGVVIGWLEVIGYVLSFLVFSFKRMECIKVIAIILGFQFMSLVSLFVIVVGVIKVKTIFRFCLYYVQIFFL